MAVGEDNAVYLAGEEDYVFPGEVPLAALFWKEVEEEPEFPELVGEECLLFLVPQHILAIIFGEGVEVSVLYLVEE